MQSHQLKYQHRPEAQRKFSNPCLSSKVPGISNLFPNKSSVCVYFLGRNKHTHPTLQYDVSRRDIVGQCTTKPQLQDITNEMA